MVKRLFGICCTAILLAGSACALAGSERVHSYTLKHGGELRLTTPSSWRDEIKPTEKGLPATIDFYPPGSKDFKVMVTPIVPPPGTATPSLGDLHDDMVKGRKEVASEAVEKHIAIRELHGPNVAGYYFIATDKAPGSGPDDYRVMMPAEVRVGRALLLVTVFYNDDSSKVREQAIAMLKSAQFKAGDSGAQDQGAADDASLKVSKIAGGYSLTVPVSRLVVILHGDKLERQPGGNFSPRYFFFEDHGRHAIISGWFEPAEEFPGIKPFWKHESGGLTSHKPGGLMNVKFENVGKWQVVAYDVNLAEGKVSNVHFRAERVQAGTWLDLHLSMTSTLSSARARAKLRDVLKSIEVKEKSN